MTETTSAMVSGWMPNGNINEFVTAHQDANKFDLVSPPPRLLQYLLVIDDYVAPVVRRSRRGPDLYARSGNGPWGSQRGVCPKA
jgi:hypothetical protein